MQTETHTIVIRTAGAAFKDCTASELARILREMADRMESHGAFPVPRDINGNVCGTVSYAMEE